MDATSLCCIICSKRPQFSDLSHLLTHVSSKAHLANYFKLQVRSHHDIRANDSLAQYDQWYEENDLARLLSDRMASATRTTRRRRSNRSFENEECESHDSLFKTEATQSADMRVHSKDGSSQSSFYLPENNIDPRLSNDQQHLVNGYQMKTEKILSSDLADSFEPLLPRKEAKSLHCSGFPKDQNVDQIGGGITSFEEKYSPDLFTAPPKTPTLSYENLRYTGLHSDVAEEKKVDEVSRLKGIQWPGMDVFDAASDVMKRQRNQKKDASTFKAMEAASCATEPNEMVFSPSGILRKEREITGFVEEIDLLPGEWCVPKHRRDRRDRRGRRTHDNLDSSTAPHVEGRQRVALAVTDPNRPVWGSRIVKRERQPKQSLSGSRMRSNRPIRTTSLTNYANGLTHSHYPTVNDEDAELQLSVNTARRRHTSRLQIFEDHDSAEAEQKPCSPAPASDIPETSTSHDSQIDLFDNQRTADAVQALMAANESERLPTLSADNSSMLAHNYSYNHTGTVQGFPRDIEGIYLVDNSLLPSYHVPYDPLVGGNVLHYRWDWNGSDLGRGASNADESLLGSGLLYNRAQSSDTTIYQDENENQSCLWLDGYSQ